MKKSHTCDLCNSSFLGKSNLLRHQNKKTKCDTITKFECKWCEKSFSTNSNLNRHELNTCRIKQEHDAKKQQEAEETQTKLKELEDKYNLLKEKIDEITTPSTNDSSASAPNASDAATTSVGGNHNATTTSNTHNPITTSQSHNTTNTNSNNITINKYGCEDMSHMTLKRITFVFDKCFRSVVECVRLKHFSPLAPQNRNVYISDLKSKHAYIFVGHKWDATGRRRLLDDMYDDICYYIEEKLEEFLHVLEPNIILRIQTFLSQKDDDETASKIKEELRLLLFNKNL